MSSRANLQLSCNPAGRSHCRLQNHHEHIKHHHRGMDSASFSNPSSLHLRHSSFSNPPAALPTSQLVLQPFRCFTTVIDISPTSQLILQLFCSFIYVTAHSTHFRCFIYVTGTSRTSPGELPMHRGMKKQAFYSKLLSLEVATVVKNFTTSSKLIFL